MNNDFVEFQEHFKHYQNLFGLSGYKVYFRHEPLEKSFAEINIENHSLVATVTLNSRLSAKDKPFKDIKLSAKHEAIHLLLGQLEDRAYMRFLTKDAIYEALEDICHRLEGIIP